MDTLSAWVSDSQTDHSSGTNSWQSAVQQYTSSLTEYGAGTNVTSTLTTTATANQQGSGSVSNAAQSGNWNNTATVTDTLRQVKTPADGGATRTLDTTSHQERTAQIIHNYPVGVVHKYTSHTEFHQYLVTAQHIGTVTESMTGSYSDYIFIAAHNRNRVKNNWTITWASLGASPPDTVTYDPYGFDTDDWFGDNEDDPWIAGIRAYAEAFIDVIVGQIANLILLATNPIYAVWYIRTLPERLTIQLRQLGEAMKALVT